MIGSIIKKDVRSVTSQKSIEKRGSFSSSSSKEEIDNDAKEKEDSEKDFVMKEVPDQDEETLRGFLLEHDIFSQLCPQEKFKKNSHCYVCKAKFRTTFKLSRKHCKFCGYYVCSDHSRKKRPDPQNKANFSSICDRCDYQYLYREIFKEYDKRRLEKEAKISEFEAQILELKDILVKKQNELTELRKEKQKKDEEYAENAESLAKKIRVLNNEIKKIENETNELNKNYSQVNESIKEIEKSLVDVQSEHVKLQQENDELTQQIVAIDKDIEQTTTIIQKIEELISQAKIEKGVNNIYKDASRNKEDEENSKKNDESSSNPGNFSSKNPTIVQNPRNPTITPHKEQFPKDAQVKPDHENCKNCVIF